MIADRCSPGADCRCARCDESFDQLATSPGRTFRRYAGLTTVALVTDLVEVSSHIIDSGVVDRPVNRVTNELSELADDLAIVESFSHCVVLDSGGLVCFDSSGVHSGEAGLQR